MIQQIEQRLKELKADFEQGQKMLAELETRQANVKSTLLRISGQFRPWRNCSARRRPMVKTGRVLQRSRQCTLRLEHSIPGAGTHTGW